jgi:uncharacterized protein YndB with AHSA1/START domain
MATKTAKKSTGKDAVADGGVFLTRLIDAPRERLWQAWADPEQMKAWFAPAPWKLSIQKMDFRKGGTFKMAMHGPEGESHGFSGTYAEVSAPSRLVWIGKFAEGPVDQVRTEVEFTAQGKKTRVVVRQTYTPVTPETKPFIDGANPGWNMTLNQLDAFVSLTTSDPDREIVIERLIAAPRERVWEAWADTKQIVQWWGPYGFTNRTKKRDFRTGGTWEHTMIGPDGREYLNFAHYIEVVKPERIVLTNGGRAKDQEGVAFRSVITFEDRGDKTLLTMRMLLPSAEMRKRVIEENGAVEGGRQTTARLDQYLNPFVITRTFDAPREKVWKAWTDAVELKKWFGPKGFKMHTAKQDLRPGGTFHYGMKSPDGQDVWGKWTYRQIEKPSLIQLVQSFSDPGGGVTRHPMAASWPLETLSTTTFEEAGRNKTRITIRWSAYNATEAEAKTFTDNFKSMEGGWGGTLAQLEEYLKA